VTVCHNGLSEKKKTNSETNGASQKVGLNMETDEWWIPIISPTNTGDRLSAIPLPRATATGAPHPQIHTATTETTTLKSPNLFVLFTVHTPPIRIHPMAMMKAIR
jgi:hypothetical protein